MSLYKIYASVLGAITAFLVSLPADAHRAAGVAIWFFAIDQVTGFIAARLRLEVTSNKFRMGFADKLLCYAKIVGLGLGLSFVTGNPAWYAYVWWGICASEALSFVENTRPMLRKGGKAMRPLSRFLDAAATWIEKLTGVQEDDAAAAPVESEAPFSDQKEADPHA